MDCQSALETITVREVLDKEYDLERFDIHSLFLWACPPTSVECLDLKGCLDVWMGGVVQGGGETISTSGLNGTIKPNRLEGARERDRTVSLPGPGPGTNAMSRIRSSTRGLVGPEMTLNEEIVNSDGFVDLGRESSRSEEKTPTVKQRQQPSSYSYPTTARIRTRLAARSARLASQREALESSWGYRERVRAELESQVERDAEALRNSRAGSAGLSGIGASGVVGGQGKKDRRKSFGLGKTVSALDPDRAGSSTVGAFDGKKKHRGMGSRIRGMISSASSIHGGLSSMVGHNSNNNKDERDRAKSQQGHNTVSVGIEGPTAVSSSRMSLQIPSRVSPALEEMDGEETYRRPKMSNRLSLQSVPSRHQDGRRSPSGASLFTQEGDRPAGGLLSPTISIMTTATESAASHVPTVPSSTAPTPTMAGSKKFPTFRDLQDQSAAEMLEEETRRVQAGRRKEGLVWSPGVWEGVGVSSGRHAGERKEKVKWESESGASNE